LTLNIDGAISNTNKTADRQVRIINRIDCSEIIDFKGADVSVLAQFTPKNVQPAIT